MTKSERITVLKKFHTKLRIAEHRHNGYEQCLYLGCVRSTEHLLVEENGMAEADVKKLRDKFDEEIKKAGIGSDQFVALYHST